MASAVNDPATPRSERRTQNRAVELFTDALGYPDREQALTQERLRGRMRWPSGSGQADQGGLPGGGGEIPPQPHGQGGRLRLGAAPQMKGASPRYAVTSPQKNFRSGAGDMQASVIPGKSTSRLQRYRLTDKGKALTGRQST